MVRMDRMNELIEVNLKLGRKIYVNRKLFMTVPDGWTYGISPNYTFHQAIFCRRGERCLVNFKNPVTFNPPPLGFI